MANLNEPIIPQSAARQPRGLVRANGQTVAGLISFQVDNNSFYQADTFRCLLALSAQPQDRDIDWWLDQDKIEIELLAGFPADAEKFSRSELESLLIGYVDDIEIDHVGRTIELSGRDHTAKLIDTKSSLTNVGNPNSLRSSDIITKIAKIAGLNPVVTPTKSASPGGSYYNIYKAIMDTNTTYWNIVTRLAQMEQFVAYVSGNDLHFEPRAISGNDAYVIQWVSSIENGGQFPLSNAMELRFSRNLYVAKDIRVIVRSHDYKKDRPVVATAEKTRIRNAVTKGVGSQPTPPVEYIYTFRNMSHADAQARANSLLLELSQHEMNLHVELPADSILTARSLIRVRGTGSRADQDYYPASIVRTLSMDEGYRMAVTAKNISPDVEMTK